MPLGAGYGMASGVVSGGPPPLPAPVVIGVVPAFGPVVGGTHVVIEVSYSAGAISASVGGVDITGFAIDDATHVSGNTVAHVGAADVTVTNGVGTSTPLVGGYTFSNFTIIGISPSSGLTTGGTHVVIEVSYSAGATSASVGGANITGFAIDDATHVSGNTVAHASGAVNVTVTNGLGTSAPLVGGYTFAAPALDYTGWWIADDYDGTTAPGQPSSGTSASHPVSNFAGQAPPATAPLLNGHKGWDVDPDHLAPGPLYGHRLDTGLGCASFISATEFTVFIVARFGFHITDSYEGGVISTIYTSPFQIGGGSASPFSPFTPSIVSHLGTPGNYRTSHTSPTDILTIESITPPYDYRSVPVIFELRAASTAAVTARINEQPTQSPTDTGPLGSTFNGYTANMTMQLFWGIYFFGGGMYRMRGHVYEIRIANRAFTLSECADVRAELAAKYGI